jgi:hypothetical protein
MLRREVDDRARIEADPIDATFRVSPPARVEAGERPRTWRPDVHERFDHLERIVEPLTDFEPSLHAKGH